MIKPRYDRRDQHGFLEFQLSIIPTNLEISLLVTNQDGYQQQFNLSIEESISKSIFFNSYFLEDGEARFQLSAHNREGTPVETLIDSYSIINGESELSCKLRNAFRASPTCALSNNPLDSTYFSSLPDIFKSSNYPREFRSGAAYTNKALSSADIANFDQAGALVLEGFFDKTIIDDAKAVLEQVSENDLFGFKKGSSQRIVNLHESYEQLNTLYSNKRLYDVVSDLFGVQAFPCQSLTFINGSTQDAHQDTVHLTPFPRGLMCGIWIAIEDVVPGAGELIFYPGSHTLPAVLCSSHNVPKVDSEDGDYSRFGEVFTPLITDLLSSNPQLERRQFLAKAGDVLIWQENLIHGGAQRVIQDQTRMSMVIHAFGEPALIYYDSLGMSGKRDASLN